MTDATKFGHDQLGHILADHLLEVPRFQRSYSWDSSNVEEFLGDLAQARSKDVDYFMGTVVFASTGSVGGRKQIVDGQQRLATTALLFIAIRDTFRRLKKDRQADEIEKRFLRGYVLAMDDEVERLILSPDDLTDYQNLLDSKAGDLAQGSKIGTAYRVCLEALADLVGESDDADRLVELSQQLESKVQVLVAEATDLPEAYVIFETLNDRGADLTTADLLKNYLFSSAKDYFRFVEERWTQLEANFDRAEDLVKFIRYDYASRHGSISDRKLYRAIQSEVAGSPRSTKAYVDRLTRAQDAYLAIKDPESSFWADANVDVRDALYAYRRFGFEASMPVLLAAFEKWDRNDATRLLIKIANWSVRATFAGRLGGGTADEAFGEAAKAISEGTAVNQPDVREKLSRLVPNDADFKAAIIGYGDISVARGKYLLAMLEKADDARHQRPAKAVEWYSRAITIEHVIPQYRSNEEGPDAAAINKLGNLALLEKRLNRSLGSKAFVDKRAAYRESAFELTKRLSSKKVWRARSVSDRTRELADLACLAWPEQ